MPSTPINWTLSPVKYGKNVIDEVNEAVRWFDVECPTSTIKNHEKLRIAVQKEIEIFRSNNDPRKVTFAIFALYYQGFLPDPLNIQFSDIQNALWVIKDHAYGIPNSPSNQNLFNATISNFSF